MVAELDKQREELAKRKEAEKLQANAYQEEVKGTLALWKEEEDSKKAKIQVSEPHMWLHVVVRSHA